jgi:hypothetical protein
MWKLAPFVEGRKMRRNQTIFIFFFPFSPPQSRKNPFIHERGERKNSHDFYDFHSELGTFFFAATEQKKLRLLTFGTLHEGG